MSKPKIGVIIGSTRQGRFADKPAQWIFDHAKAHGAFEVELVDLRDYDLPFFDEPVSPAWGPSKSEAAQRWQKKVDELDGYIMVAAEYNRGPTASLKNAIDYAYNEWNRKPVAFVGYGGVGGARAVEQLRLHAVELQMAPTRPGVHIVWADMAQVMDGSKRVSDFPHLEQQAKVVLDDLAWWVAALKSARAGDAVRKAA